MSKSPGHAKWPSHQVLEVPQAQRVSARFGDTTVASSENVLRVDEDEAPARFYFPRTDVRMDLLEHSDTKTQCPFKGTASYFNLRIGDRVLKDAAWTYESPFDEHVALKGRVAFYEENAPGLRIEGR